MPINVPTTTVTRRVSSNKHAAACLLAPCFYRTTYCPKNQTKHNQQAKTKKNSSTERRQRRTSSGLMLRHSSIRPLKRALSLSCRAGTRVLPPTRTTSVTSVMARDASLSTVVTVLMHLVKSSSLRDSNFSLESSTDRSASSRRLSTCDGGHAKRAGEGGAKMRVAAGVESLWRQHHCAGATIRDLRSAHATMCQC